MKELKSIGVVPARMGSSRFPNKPMKKILGIPLIGHVFLRSKLISGLDEVVVATCDNEIYDYISELGGKVIMTSASHERATDRTAEALTKIEEKYDIVAMIQGDEPLFSPQDVDEGLTKLLTNEEHNIVNLMFRITTDEEFKSLNNVKVLVDKFSNALYFSREPVPSNWKGNHKESLFQQTGLMIFRKLYLDKYLNLDPTPLEIIESCDMLRVLEHGDKVQMLEISTKSVGVDVESDIEIAEKLMKTDRIFNDFIKGC